MKHFGCKSDVDWVSKPYPKSATGPAIRAEVMRIMQGSILWSEEEGKVDLSPPHPPEFYKHRPHG